MADDALTRKEAEMDRIKDSELLSTTDGRIWAQQFNLVFANLYPGGPLDEGWLIGWFANAIETGRTAGQRSLESVREKALLIAAEDLSMCLHDEESAGWNIKDRTDRCWLAMTVAINALRQSPARVAEGDDIVNLRNKAQVMHDLHDALGVKWGDDPYAEIRRLKSIEKLCDELLAQRSPAPDSPSKEQPGEQNAAPSGATTASHSVAGSNHAESVSLKVAAPDVAAMVRRLRERADYFVAGETYLLLREAAALIEKLGQVEIAWLIESIEYQYRNPPHYWSGFAPTDDPNQAVKFADERSATKVIESKLGYKQWKATEHMWPLPPPERP